MSDASQSTVKPNRDPISEGRQNTGSLSDFSDFSSSHVESRTGSPTSTSATSKTGTTGAGSPKTALNKKTKSKFRQNSEEEAGSLSKQSAPHGRERPMVCAEQPTADELDIQSLDDHIKQLTAIHLYLPLRPGDSQQEIPRVDVVEGFTSDYEKKLSHLYSPTGLREIGAMPTIDEDLMDKVIDTVNRRKSEIDNFRKEHGIVLTKKESLGQFLKVNSDYLMEKNKMNIFDPNYKDIFEEDEEYEELQFEVKDRALQLTKKKKKPLEEMAKVPPQKPAVSPPRPAVSRPRPTELPPRRVGSPPKVVVSPPKSGVPRAPARTARSLPSPVASVQRPPSATIPLQQKESLGAPPAVTTISIPPKK